MSQQPKHILVVDDEENSRVSLSRLLLQEGYQVDSVADGDEALTFVASKDVHLVISDINMPRMDGLELLRELNSSYPRISVIMITAYGEVESYLDAMRFGAMEYIHKPVRLDELKLAMQRIFTPAPLLAD
ncbi:MAG: response regulator [Desulfuromonas sp.]|nr:MAG: response regulator [Desulfuromonas sp.]